MITWACRKADHVQKRQAEELKSSSVPGPPPQSGQEGSSRNAANDPYTEVVEVAAAAAERIVAVDMADDEEEDLPDEDKAQLGSFDGVAEPAEPANPPKLQKSEGGPKIGVDVAGAFRRSRRATPCDNPKAAGGGGGEHAQSSVPSGQQPPLPSQPLGGAQADGQQPQA